MAKKKKIIDLKSSNINYLENSLTHKVNNLRTSSMTVDISVYNKEVFVENKTIPFAHLPKAIKQMVKPV